MGGLGIVYTEVVGACKLADKGERKEGATWAFSPLLVLEFEKKKKKKKCHLSTRCSQNRLKHSLPRWNMKQAFIACSFAPF